jgi:hypothetical protein
MYESTTEISNNRVNGPPPFTDSGLGGGVMLWWDGGYFALNHGKITSNTAENPANGTQFYWYLSGQPWSNFYVGDPLILYSGNSGPINSSFNY